MKTWRLALAVVAYPTEYWQASDGDFLQASRYFFE